MWCAASRRTVEQYLDVSVEVDKNVLQERISEEMRDQISRKRVQCCFMLWEIWSTLCTGERVRADVDKAICRKRISARSQIFDVPRTWCRGGTTF